MNKKLTILSITAIMATLIGGVHTALANTVVIVTPGNMDGWGFQLETGAGAGDFVVGPATAPLGQGSAHLTTSSSSGGIFIGAALYAGTRLDSITNLEYSTYQSMSSSSTVQAISLQFNIDDNVNDGDIGWKGRLVFEPYYTETVAKGSWQTWDPQTQGRWWGTGATISAFCSIGSPCTWAQVLSHFPNAGIHSVFGIVLFKAGSGWPAGFDGNVDAFTIGVSGIDTTYDFEPVLSPCAVAVDSLNMILTLTANCTTDHTLYIPNGWTLDGGGFTITAVDPPSPGHFLGAVVKNGGATARVTNLTVTASGLTNVCDGGNDRLRGILFDGAGGSITNNTVTDINQGVSGCQEGNGIEVRNEPFDNTGADLAVTISGNTVTGYQKNGITANGSVATTILNNTVTGAGPVNYIAQNGIQIGFGGTATVKGNTASGNDYTPASYVACGILYYQADGVRASRNTVFANERDMCNFGKGGGKFSPNP